MGYTDRDRERNWRENYKQSVGTSFRAADPYLQEDRRENPSATRHVSYYDDDISDLENSVLRGGI